MAIPHFIKHPVGPVLYKVPVAGPHKTVLSFSLREWKPWKALPVLRFSLQMQNNFVKKERQIFLGLQHKSCNKEADQSNGAACVDRGCLGGIRG